MQDAYKSLNFQRQEIKDKLQEIVQNVKDIEESSYDEEDYKEEAV